MTEPVRVGIVSDTHGYLDPRVVDAISGCDFAVHAGDVGGAPVLEELQAHCGRVVAVAGNNDSAARWLPNEALVVTSLTISAEVPLPGGVLVAEHGEQHGFHAPCHASLRRHHPHARHRLRTYAPVDL